MKRGIDWDVFEVEHLGVFEVQKDNESDAFEDDDEAVAWVMRTACRGLDAGGVSEEQVVECREAVLEICDSWSRL